MKLSATRAGIDFSIGPARIKSLITKADVAWSEENKETCVEMIQEIYQASDLHSEIYGRQMDDGPCNKDTIVN